ncbi:N-methyl-L-tryptophan oxidase [Aggregatilineales bacterium SYSU G02658]
MTRTTYDVIVIGGGGMGSAAAYYAAREGHSVLLLEQFELNHERGSSNDHSRIIRYAYDHPIYVELMRSAYALWRDLEAEAGEQLYFRTGGIDIAHPNQPTFDSTRQCLADANIPFEFLDAQSAQARFPMFRFDPDMQVLYQPDSGILAAARCVQAHLRLAVKHGAAVKEKTPVQRIVVHQDSVTVVADQAYSAERVILAGGAWMNELLAHVDLTLPLEPMGVQLAYFAPQAMEQFSAEQMPVFITHLRGDKADWVYGIPSIHDSGLKVALHTGQRVQRVAEIDYTPKDETIDHIRRFIRQYLPEADAPVKNTRICLYTMTPDEHFIVDTHPAHPNVVIASPCSGHGFKFSTLIGRMLADLALLGSTAYDTSLFKVSRFL